MKFDVFVESLLGKFETDLAEIRPDLDIASVMEVARFAAEVHVGMVREYTGEPYLVHLIEVAMTTARVGGDESMVKAGLLHDTVEMTDITVGVLDQEFGSDVADLVDGLTDKTVPADGNRMERKKKDSDRLAQASPRVQTVKLADVLSNVKTIVQRNRKFAKTYIDEKMYQVSVMTSAMPSLMAEVIATLEAGKASLAQ